MAEIDRYYAYQTLFSSRKAVPKMEFLKKLEISPATFKRDLTMLRDRLNTPILYGNRPLEPRALEVEFFPMEEVLHEKVKIH